MTKSPGTNSPVSSTKKQRSASPSYATPRSACSSSVLPTMNSRFSGSSGFGSWFGKVPSGSKKHVTASIGRRSSTGGSIAPAIPFAASMTTLSGRIAETSTNESTLSTNSARCPSASTSPASHGGPNGFSARSRTSSRPDSPPTGSAPRAHDLHPRVLLRVVRGGDADAAVELELADGEIDHLRPDHPEVEHVGAAVGGAVDQRRGHRRRREAHVAADRDPPRLELLDVGAADRVRAFLVELVRVDAADVVGLEDAGSSTR